MLQPGLTLRAATSDSNSFHSLISKEDISARSDENSIVHASAFQLFKPQTFLGGKHSLRYVLLGKHALFVHPSLSLPVSSFSVPQLGEPSRQVIPGRALQPIVCSSFAVINGPGSLSHVLRSSERATLESSKHHSVLSTLTVKLIS